MAEQSGTCTQAAMMGACRMLWAQKNGRRARMTKKVAERVLEEAIIVPAMQLMMSLRPAIS